MKTGVRPLAVLTAIASALAVGATVYWSQRWNLVTIAILIALAWSAILAFVDALTGWRRPPLGAAASERTAPITYLMRLGEERVDIARTSVMLAAQAGPVVVVATRHHEFLDDLGDLEVTEHVASTVSEAMEDALRTISTDAVLVMSASAFPIGDACGHAAAQLTNSVGWVIGSAPAFNNDRYAPGERELIGARTRAAGREVGLDSWEPDATIVRTSILREHPLQPGRPDGRWLRDRAATGWHGLTWPDAVAVRAAPADAPVFWPTQTKRRRGAVADLADAITTGPAVARLAALGGLLRELYAYPLVLWLVAIVAVGRSGAFPFTVSAGAFFSLQAALGLLRWVSSRLTYDVGLHPVDEARGAAYDVPGSLLALPSALTRRVRPVRFDIPDQPLLWLALVVTLLTTIPLLDRKAVSGDTVGVAVGLAVTALAATWIFALRAFGSRGWDRASYRLAVDAAATINGEPVRTVDASPSGLGVVGSSLALTRDAPVEVSVAFDAAPPVIVRGHVTDLRNNGDRCEIGVALDLSSDERAAWVGALFAAAVSSDQSPDAFAAPLRPRRVFQAEQLPLRRRLIAALQVVAVSGVSLLVFAALLLALLGYRPMVVRSGSMVPTLGIGDVVVANWVHADQVRPGEIISFPANILRPEIVTHRVQKIVVDGDMVHVQTKGDHNTEPEEWSTRRDALVGHVEWRIPKIGRLLIVLGESSTRWFLLGLTLALGMVVVATGTIRRRRHPQLALGSS